MAERIFTSNAYKIVEALAQKLGFSTLEDYLQTLLKIEAKESFVATPLVDKSLENILNGIKEGLLQLWGDGLPGGDLWDQVDDEIVENNHEQQNTIISVEDLRQLHVDAWWENHYEVNAKAPLSWWFSARKLRRSAELLHDIAEVARERESAIFVEEIEANKGNENISGSRYLSDEEVALSLDSSVDSVAFMLQGLAIENLAKGILVSRNADALVVTGKFRRKTHGLIELFKECKVSLTEKERNILEIATDYIAWRGRYFVPLKVDELRPKERKWSSNLLDNFHERDNFHRGDYEVLVSICDRLLDVYEEERQKRHAAEDKAAQSNM